MKKAQRIVILLLTLAIMAAMFVLTPVSASAASLNYKSVVVAVDDEFTIKLRKAKGEVEWSSADEDIATVSGGVITGVSTGKTTVTAKYKGKTYSCKVSVKKYYVDGSKKMTVNDTQTLKVKGDTEGKTIKWSSSQPDIASVGIKGKVTARKVGTAKIYATIDGKRYVKTITVYKGFSLNASELKLEKGKGFFLIASKIPTGKKVTWSSANDSIATVDSSGYVKGIKNGKTTITAKAGTKTAECIIKVQPVDCSLPDDFKDLTYENIMSGIEFGMSRWEVQKTKGMINTSNDYSSYFGKTDVINNSANSADLERCWIAYYSQDEKKYYPMIYVKYHFWNDKLSEVEICIYSLYETSYAYWDAVDSMVYAPIVDNILRKNPDYIVTSLGSMVLHNSIGDQDIAGRYFEDKFVNIDDSSINGVYKWHACEPNYLYMPEYYYIKCTATISSDKY